MKTMTTLLVMALLPVAVAAQQDPSKRLAEVLPPAVAQQVLQVMATAQARELPPQAIANIALEGVAKGRSSDDVLAAVGQLAGDMGRAQDALLAAGHTPVDGEIEAATAAIRMGVDGASISELARSGAPGRSLAVPLLVMGGLAERGLPSDQALAAVRDRLAAKADDASLLHSLPEMANGLGRGTRPDQVGVGPQANHGRRPEGRGRGGGPPGP
jgi:hypothetical protein